MHYENKTFIGSTFVTLQIKQLEISQAIKLTKFCFESVTKLDPDFEKTISNPDPHNQKSSKSAKHIADFRQHCIFCP
jgi:hypothetical protein